MITGIEILSLLAAQAEAALAKAQIQRLIERTALFHNGILADNAHITHTGTTLKENGLEPYETVAPISARVIVNLASMKLKKQQIQALTEQLQEGLRAKDEAKKEAQKAESKQDK